MKIIGKRVVPAREVEYVENVLCDLCKRKGGKEDNGGSIDWGVKGNEFEFDRVCVARETGHNYPEFQSLNRHSFHICPDCWETKLLPWLQEQETAGTKEEVY